MTDECRLKAKTNKETYEEGTITHNYMNEVRILYCFCLDFKDIPTHEECLISLLEKIHIISNDDFKKEMITYKLFLIIFFAEHQRQSMITFYEFQSRHLAYGMKTRKCKKLLIIS